MKNITVCINPHRDSDFKKTKEIKNFLAKNGIEPYFCLLFAPPKESVLPDDIVFSSIVEVLPLSSLLICLGGDATILHTARIAAVNHVPILGINTGHVGFMADMEWEEYPHILDFVAGRYTIDTRMMVETRVLRNGTEVFSGFGLNDAVVSKGMAARQIELSVYCDSHKIVGFSGDGVIVATPTGSTAYSMSAGGPIIDPMTQNMVITPICAHSMRVKPFVLADSRVVEIRLGNMEGRDAYLSLDGTTPFELMTNDAVLIKKSNRSADLARVMNRSFYDIVNLKLDART